MDAIEVLERDPGRLDVSGFFFRLQQAAALVDDIHTSVFPLADQGILLATVPVRLRRLSGGIYVRAVRGDLAWLLGAQVLEIEGRPIDSVLEIREFDEVFKVLQPKRFTLAGPSSDNQ